MQYNYSIIIPHFEIPELLGRLLRTIPERDDVQVIVVDDCSKDADKYMSAVPELSRKNVEFVKSKRNGGGGAARNIGLSHAKGKWLIFPDADDLFTDNFNDILDRYVDAPEDILFFRISSVMSEDTEQQSERHLYRNEALDKFKQDGDEIPLRYNTPEAWAKMIRRDFVVKNGLKYDETRVANDWMFSATAGYYADKIRLTDECMYILTERPGSVSRGGWASSIDKLLIRLHVAARVEAFLVERGIRMRPAAVRGFMVLLMKHKPTLFIKELMSLPKPIKKRKVIADIFNPKFFN